MSNKLKVALIAIVALAGGAAVAGASGDDDANDKPITGAALERASRIAVAHVGGGKVTGTEAGDEQGAYEIEVTKPGGSQVDVHLDRAFNVIGTEADEADAGER